MKIQVTSTRTTGANISLRNANVAVAIVSLAALLVSGLGAGRPPSALAYA